MYAGSRLRVPGSREYTGYRLRVYYSHDTGQMLIDHDTTETYRQNYEVAQRIIEYEETKKDWKK